MCKAIVIWVEFEKVEVRIIPTVSNHFQKLLEACHDKYINIGEEGEDIPVLELHDWFKDNPENWRKHEGCLSGLESFILIVTGQPV